MRKLLAVILLCFLAVASAFGQARKLPVGGTLGGTLGGTSPSDTIPILHWTFTGGMPPNVTEVGGVSVASFGGSNCLKVTVDGGGSDYIQQTIPSCSEYWLRMRFHITGADTAGWDNAEYIRVAKIAESGTENGKARIFILRDGADLKWCTFHTDDDGTGHTSGGTTLSTDTWYNIVCHIKKGNGTGILNLKVDGVEVTAVADWDNNATVHNQLFAGESASTLNAIYYIDNVRLYSPEGLP